MAGTTELIELTPQELQRRQKHNVIWMIFAGLFVLVAVSLFAFGIYQAIEKLLEASATGQWDDIYWNSFFDFTTPLIFAAITALRPLRLMAGLGSNQELTVILALREGAALGDERIAPLAEYQLSAALEKPLPALPAQFAPPRRPNKAQPLTITADEQGLCWTRPGLPADGVLLSWNEIRSFILLSFGLVRTSKSHYAPSHYIFVVDGKETTLAWEVQYNSTEAMLQSSDDLTHLIFARTGLPLRTYATDALTLLGDRWRGGYHKIWQVLRETPTVAFANPYLDTLKRPVPRSRPYLLVCLASVPLLCIPALWVAGWIVQHH